jgi:multiple sugar transport system permease protein
MKNKTKKGIKVKKVVNNFVLYGFLIIGFIIMVFPFYWMLISSVKPREELLTYPPVLYTLKPTIEYYKQLFSLIPMQRYLFNSLFVALAVTITNLFLSSLAGYAFAKHKFYGKNFLFTLILGSMMVPWQVNIIPSFIIVKKLGWLNSFYGLIIPAMVNAFGIFFMRQMISTIPNELIDAAHIDGCSEPYIFLRIILPLSKPGLATLAIFSFMSQWNNFVWPLIIIHKSDMRTVPLSLAVLNSQFGNNFGLLMAGASISILPMLIVFVFLQKYIVKGIVFTGLKE